MAKKSQRPWRVAPPATIRALQRRLIAWYRQHGRNLPWRRTRDPYAILVSEVMLQQTQVQRALLYYEKFLQRYPTLEELAHADALEVRETWEGLGYYARAHNLQRATQQIVVEYSGRFPNRLEELTALPGIGPTRAKRLATLGIEKIGDLRFHFPHRYVPYPPPQNAASLGFQHLASFCGLVSPFSTL